MLTAGIACLALGAVLAAVVATGALEGFDSTLGKPMVVDDHGALFRLLRWIERVFEFWPFVAYTAVLVVALAVKGYRRAAVWATGVTVVSLLVNQGMKHLIDRPRPSWEVHEHPYIGLSFPSGHALHAAAFFGITATLATIFIRKAPLRRLLVTGSVVVALVIALDRLLLGRHHVTDVVGGLAFGAGLVLVGFRIYSPLPVSHAIHFSPLVDTVPGGRTLHVVLNPIKVESVGQFQAIVSAMAREAGWNEPVWHLTTVEDSGTGMAAAASVAGADLVMVCGGDGTVREVCAELAGTGIPVGIIPAGTGNLLARNLAIPLYLRAAIDVALTGQDRAVDLVEVAGDGMDDSHFLVMAGMGFDAAIMDGVNEDLKKKVGWIAYVVSALKALMFPAVKVQISVDGGEFTKHRARTIVVGNVGTLTAGMPLLPDAQIDDGLLDVVLLYPQRFWSWLPLAFRVLTKRPETDDLVNRMRGRSIVVRADRDTPRQLDGDTVGEGREMRMTCLHARLLVRVPR
jgi:YegS/Rv2252/BmrU family lipid kinase